jgi:hypothetical protein
VSALVAILGISHSHFDVSNNWNIMAALFRERLGPSISPAFYYLVRLLGKGQESAGQLLDIEVGLGGCNLIAVLLGFCMFEVILEVEPAELAIIGGRYQFVVILC